MTDPKDPNNRMPGLISEPNRSDPREGTCVICGKWLPAGHEHVDTCSERCYKKLLAKQRQHLG